MNEAIPHLSLIRDGHVATVLLRRPAHNFFNLALLTDLADMFDSLQADEDCRAVVLAADGKSFCAGADFSAPAPDAGPDERSDPGLLYAQGLRLFAAGKPIVAAVQGSAIGGGLGLALVADFRVSCAEARFSANFAKLGFHAGFGLSHTLPRLLGPQQASLLLFTGRRIDGMEAARIGLVDELVSQSDVRSRAVALAQEIAASAPLAVASMRTTLRTGLVDSIRAAIVREASEQGAQFNTADFREGVAAAAARRNPVFSGR